MELETAPERHVVGLDAAANEGTSHQGKDVSEIREQERNHDML